MRRVLLRMLAAIALLAFAAVLAGFLVLRASLPLLDGELEFAELQVSATIGRDAAGVAHIMADNRVDLAFATGFAHGQDRFFQMDLMRRQSAGELSALVGPAALDIDRRNRLHRFRARARQRLQDLDTEHRTLLQRYAEGVNAGLSSLRARPFEYFVLGAGPRDWKAEDSLLTVYAMFLELNDERATKDVRLGTAASILAKPVYRWMYPDGSEWDAPLVGAPHASVAIPAADVLSLRGVADVVELRDEPGSAAVRGSNNWAVSGELTESGRALVANDMHLTHGVPNIYYRARLQTTGTQRRDVTGVTLPGTPFVIAGSNTHIAWGYTNSYGDYSDAVIIRPGDTPGSYRTAAGERQFDVYRERIDVRGGDAVVHEIRETIWGPVLDGETAGGDSFAVSWIAHKPEAINLELLRLEMATSVSEAMEIANTMGIPPQNFTVGDADGRIGWTIAGRIPDRQGYDSSQPADWSGGAGWRGWVAPEDYPRVENPADGRIWTANARVADGKDLRTIGDGGYDLGARARQIRDALFVRNVFSPRDMLAIQTDDRALFLLRWQKLLLEVLDRLPENAEPALHEYRRLVANWIPRASPDSVGYRLVRAFRFGVRQRLFFALTVPIRDVQGADVPLYRSNQFEAPLWAAVSARPDHLLPGSHHDWDAFLLAVVRQTIDQFERRYDGPLSERNWGELNTAAIRHPLSRALPMMGWLLDMPANQLGGDQDMPLVQGPDFGASERFAVSPGDEQNGIFQMPAGQSGHPLSDFYRHGHDDWETGRPSPFLPGGIEHTLTLSPRSR